MIRLLDCTLRDGGHVNQAQFGRDNMTKMIRGLVDAGVDDIELGFLRDGTFSAEQALYNDVKEIGSLLPDSKKKSRYAVMIRPDWYDITQLSESDGSIDVIRFAFYYRDIQKMLVYAKIVKEKGYHFICNPVNINGYTDNELLELTDHMNEIHPEQLTIVDTYGIFEFQRLHHVYSLLEENLDKEIRIGLHLHENRSLSFALAQYLLGIRKTERDVEIDASLLGMGRIPGNLPIELIAEYLNERFEAVYDTDILYALIGDYIQPIKKEHPWGYSPEYYLTAKYNMHRSYAEWLRNQKNLSLGEMNDILKNIEKKEYRDYFNEAIIEELYIRYKGEKRWSRKE